MMFHICTLDIFMRHFNRILQNTGGWTTTEYSQILRWILTLKEETTTSYQGTVNWWPLRIPTEQNLSASKLIQAIM